jgi:hypothetical protein
LSAEDKKKILFDGELEDPKAGIYIYNASGYSSAKILLKSLKIVYRKSSSETLGISRLSYK